MKEFAKHHLDKWNWLLQLIVWMLMSAVFAVMIAQAESIMDVPTNLDLFGPKVETIPAQWQGTVTLSWPASSCAGDTIFLGTSPVNPSWSVDIAPTNAWTGVWDVRLPCWFSIGEFWEIAPETNYYGAIAVTNTRDYSTTAPILLWTPALQPSGWVSNGTYWLMGYGQSNVNYTVKAGALLDGTNVTDGTKVFQTTGTNGPWFYTETLQPGARFFKTEVQP